MFHMEVDILAEVQLRGLRSARFKAAPPSARPLCLIASLGIQFSAVPADPSSLSLLPSHLVFRPGSEKKSANSRCRSLLALAGGSSRLSRVERALTS